jgi:hypothetical protein
MQIKTTVSNHVTLITMATIFKNRKLLEGELRSPRGVVFFQKTQRMTEEAGATPLEPQHLFHAQHMTSVMSNRAPEVGERSRDLHAQWR